MADISRCHSAVTRQSLSCHSVVTQLSLSSSAVLSCDSAASLPLSCQPLICHSAVTRQGSCPTCLVFFFSGSGKRVSTVSIVEAQIQMASPDDMDIWTAGASSVRINGRLRVQDSGFYPAQGF
jgi:hypothetical protein